MSNTVYFTDAATRGVVHSEHVEHDELELTDDELRGLKNRARRAVTMDGGAPVSATFDRFLRPDTRDTSYDAFLRGEHRR